MAAHDGYTFDLDPDYFNKLVSSDKKFSLPAPGPFKMTNGSVTHSVATAKVMYEHDIMKCQHTLCIRVGDHAVEYTMSDMMVDDPSFQDPFGIMALWDTQLFARYRKGAKAKYKLAHEATEELLAEVQAEREALGASSAHHAKQVLDYMDQVAELKDRVKSLQEQLKQTHVKLVKATVECGQLNDELANSNDLIQNILAIVSVEEGTTQEVLDYLKEEGLDDTIPF